MEDEVIHYSEFNSCQFIHKRKKPLCLIESPFFSSSSREYLKKYLLQKKAKKKGKPGIPCKRSKGNRTIQQKIIIHKEGRKLMWYDMKSILYSKNKRGKHFTSVYINCNMLSECGLRIICSNNHPRLPFFFCSWSVFFYLWGRKKSESLFCYNGISN